MPRPLRLLALLACLVPAASAQEVPRGGTVTLDEAIEIAVVQSPQVRRDELADETLALAVSGARADRLPAVNAFVAPQQRYGLAFDQTTGEVVTQTSETVSLGLSGSVRLYDGRRTRYAVERARLERDAASAGLERTRQQVALDVAQQFLQLLLDRELVEIQTEQLAAAERQRDRVAELVEAGARPRGDLIAQEAVVAERQTALVEAAGAVERDEAVLVQLVGLDPLGDYTFVGPSLEALEAAGLTDYAPAPLADLVAAARAARADRRAQELQIAAAEAAVGSARAAGRPSVDLDASVGSGYSSLQQRVVGEAPPVPITLADGTPIFVGGQPFLLPGDPALATTPLFTQFGDNRSGAIGLTLSVPIFDRFQTRRAVAEARLRAEDARIQLDALDRQVASEVQQAAVEARTAGARLGAAEVQVDASAAALRVERDRYDLGAGTLYDVAEAQARLAEAESARAQAAYGLVFRIALVRLAVGDVAVEDLAESVVGG